MEEKRKRGRPPGKAKTGGRKPGTPNKVTSDLRTFYAELIDKNREEIEKRLKRADDATFLQMIDRLNKYVIPTLSSTTVDATVNAGARMDQLNHDQLNRIIDQVIDESDGQIERAADRSDKV